MYDDYPPFVQLPLDLSDEGAAKVLAFLQELAAVFENQYAAQLHRFSHHSDHRQADLWDDPDPPF